MGSACWSAASARAAWPARTRRGTPGGPSWGPSRGLLDAFHGKGGYTPLPWADYVPRYLAEMEGPGQLWRIRDLARRLAQGETITLLCSAACTDPERCHRTLLAGLLAPGEAPRRRS